MKEYNSIIVKGSIKGMPKGAQFYVKRRNTPARWEKKINDKWFYWKQNKKAIAGGFWSQIVHDYENKLIESRSIVLSKENKFCLKPHNNVIRIIAYDDIRDKIIYYNESSDSNGYGYLDGDQIHLLSPHCSDEEKWIEAVTPMVLDGLTNDNKGHGVDSVLKVMYKLIKRGGIPDVKFTGDR